MKAQPVLFHPVTVHLISLREDHTFIIMPKIELYTDHKL